MKWMIKAPEGCSAPTGYGVTGRARGFNICHLIPINIIFRLANAITRKWWKWVKYPSWLFGWFENEWFSMSEEDIKKLETRHDIDQLLKSTKVVGRVR